MIRRRFSPLWTAAVSLVAAIAAIWTLFPIFWMLSTSLKENLEVFKVPPDLWPEHLTVASYINLNNDIAPIPTFFRNSVITSAATVVFAVALAMFAGYALSRLRFRFRRATLIGVLMTQMFPLVVLLIPMYLLYVRAMPGTTCCSP